MKQRSRLDIRKFFFSQRVIDHWNNLPDYVVKAINVNSFKNKLNTYWHTMSFKIGLVA